MIEPSRKLVEILIVIEILLLSVVVACSVQWWEFVRTNLGQLIGTVFAALTALSAGLAAWQAAWAKIRYDEAVALRLAEAKQADSALALYYELDGIRDLLHHARRAFDNAANCDAASAVELKEYAIDQCREIHLNRLRAAGNNVSAYPLSVRDTLFSTLLEMEKLIKLALSAKTYSPAAKTLFVRIFRNHIEILEMKLTLLMKKILPIARRHGLLTEEVQTQYSSAHEMKNRLAELERDADMFRAELEAMPT